MAILGGCACGALRYVLRGSPFFSAYCHCESCRSVSGRPVSRYLSVGRRQVAWSGERQFLNTSPGVTRGFCGQCDMLVHYMSTRWPGEIHLYAGTLDDQRLFRPTAHVHWAARVPWIGPVDNLPKHDGRGQ